MLAILVMAGPWACGGLELAGPNDASPEPDDAAAESVAPPAPDSAGGVDVRDGPDDVRPGDASGLDAPADIPLDVTSPIDAKPPPVDAMDVSPPESGPDTLPPPDADASPVDGAAPPPTTLASGQTPQMIAADDTNVYWLNGDGSLLSCPTSGCPGGVGTLLASNGPGLGYSGYPGEIAVYAASTVYYADNTLNVSDCASTGCGLAPTTYAAGTIDASFPFEGEPFIVTDATNVYFSDGADLFQCPALASCSGPIVLATWEAVDGGAHWLLGPIAVSPTEVYYAVQWPIPKILAVPIGGGPTRTVCEEFGPMAPSEFVYAGAYVYFIDHHYAMTEIQACASDGSSFSPTTYVTDTGPMGLATDGVNVYWGNDALSTHVSRCAVGAACAAPYDIATGQDIPSAVAVNSTTVFWITETEVNSAPK